MKTITALLDSPNVLEPLDYDAIYARRKASFLALWSEEEQQAWADVLALESEPVVKLLQESAYLELLLRARINDVARSNLLAYAYQSDLDHLAAFYGVERRQNEEDEPFRLRIRERIQASSTAGPVAHYRYHTLSASPQIASAHIDSPRPGLVRIAIIAKDEQQGLVEADNALLNEVRQHLNSDGIKVLTDTLEVVPAQVQKVNIHAHIWLLPDSSQAEFDRLKVHLQQQAKTALTLGRNLTRSWLTKALHTEAVQKVDIISPLADVLVTNDQAIALDQIELRLMGNDY